MLSKSTIIEGLIIVIFYILLNKILFFLLFILLAYLIYKANKPSTKPLPKELENKKMKAFMENYNTSSNLMKDKFIFKEDINIPRIKDE